MRCATGLALVLAGVLFSRDARAADTRELEALRVAEPILVDGLLTEVAWKGTPLASDFVQREPFDGQPASERTEIRVVYSSAVLYIGVRAIDSQPDAVIAREMARDSDLRRDDSIMVFLDTFLDRRNAYFFATNPNGARIDALVTDEGRDVNRQWDGVWNVSARRTADGWQAELAIPFSTLRFDPSLDRWGFQVMRRIRRNNEEVFWSPLPREANNMRISMAGDLVGLADLRPTRRLHVKPFFVGTRDDAGAGRGESGDVGLDMKWSVTRNLNLDVTLNTDFAEVEVDDQRTNITRFPLFFPEKREFFLENAGIFEFGSRFLGNPWEAPLLKLFFSRRIGLEAGEEVPIDGGVRLTGRAGPWSIGTLGVAAGASASVDDTGFGVVRVKRNIGERSSIGVLATQRDERGAPTNTVFGVDADFSPTDKLNFSGFLSRSRDKRVQGDETALGAGGAFSGREWNYGLDYLEIGDAFRPETGFLLRDDIRRFRPIVGYQPRIERGIVRNLGFSAGSEYVSRLSDDVMETRSLDLNYFEVRTFKDDSIWLDVNWTTERLFEPFEVADGVIIPPGRYSFEPLWGYWFNSGTHRPMSGSIGILHGGFYDGDRFSILSTFDVRPSRFFQAQLGWNHDDISLPQGSFELNVYSLRMESSLTPDHRIASFLQYNDSGQVAGVNLRYNWIYRPGADLFLVYNQTWDAPSLDRRRTADRQFIVKFTTLIQP
ncbi:MAG: DUF5916 domain-containing protein [Acidobacteriota bacterium]|nr:DUF5916 domain-containing protein [Acidobacteriota bacterium]